MCSKAQCLQSAPPFFSSLYFQWEDSLVSPSATNVSTNSFYGVDYNSHMGTKRAGMATVHNGIFCRSIHNIENTYFRTKFEGDLDEFSGSSGIGVISDTDAQPIIVNCHLGKFAIVTVGRINNIDNLENDLLAKGAPLLRALLRYHQPYRNDLCSHK